MADEVEEAPERGRRVIAALVAAGRERGLHVATEYPVPGGRLDVVWLWQPPRPIPGVSTAMPLVGFEVESSWRTRKHLKGDFLNLLDLGPALGIVVLLGDGAKVESTRAFAQTMVDRPGTRVLVWSEDDVRALTFGETELPSSVTAPDPETASRRPPDGPVEKRGEHTGRYRALWAWLTDQRAAEIPISFSAIEEIIGMPLPPSSRNHQAHWSGYEGSAVSRAIRDAGYRSSRVNLTAETLTFVRERPDS